MEQLYLTHADGNVIRRNVATGGTQGLEMRFSSNNDFSYNVWAGSPLQWLENDNNDNAFLYEHFEGRVVVGTASTGNVFRLSEFSNPDRQLSHGGRGQRDRSSTRATSARATGTCRRRVAR